MLADTVVRRLDHLSAYLVLEGFGAGRGRRELRGRGAARRVPWAFQRVAAVLALKPFKEGRSFMDFPASTGPVSEDFADTVPHSGCSLPLIRTDAGLVEGNGTNCDRHVLLIGKKGHDLHVLEASDRLSIDVGDQLVAAQASIPGWAFLVHSLQRGGGGVVNEVCGLQFD